MRVSGSARAWRRLAAGFSGPAIAFVACSCLLLQTDGQKREPATRSPGPRIITRNAIPSFGQLINWTGCRRRPLIRTEFPLLRCVSGGAHVSCRSPHPSRI